MPSLLVPVRLRTVAGALLVVALLVGGAFTAGLIGAPSVSGVENRFGPVNETTTVVETNLTVSNPNPIGVSLGGLTVDYEVLMNDVSLASGQKEGLQVGTGNTTVPFRTTARNERIPAWWISHVRNDEETTVTVDTSVRSSTLGRTVDPPNVTREVETDLLSQFNSSETRPVNADRPFVSDPVLYVNETSAQWGTVTDEKTPMELTFVVYNPKSYPIGVSRLDYDITMNDVAVGNGTTDSEYVVPPKSTETIEATVSIRNDRIDEWWVSHLERNQVTDLRIEFAARLDLADTSVRVPLDSLTYTRTIETDIFGTKPATENGTATATPSDSSGGDGGTATDRDGTATDGDGGTATETASSTSTTVPVPGSTDTETSTPTDAATSTSTATEGGSGTTTTDGGLLGLG